MNNISVKASNYAKPLPRWAMKLKLSIKSVSVGLAGTALMQGHPEVSSYIAIGSMVTTEIINFFDNADANVNQNQ